MAHLEAATKAPLASILPALLSVSYAEQNGSLPASWLPVTKTYQQAAKLDNDSLIRLTPPEGESKALNDQKIIEELLSVSQAQTDAVCGPLKSWIPPITFLS